MYVYACISIPIRGTTAQGILLRGEDFYRNETNELPAESMLLSQAGISRHQKKQHAMTRRCSLIYGRSPTGHFQLFIRGDGFAAFDAIG